MFVEYSGPGILSLSLLSTRMITRRTLQSAMPGILAYIPKALVTMVAGCLRVNLRQKKNDKVIILRKKNVEHPSPLPRHFTKNGCLHQTRRAHENLRS